MNATLLRPRSRTFVQFFQHLADTLHEPSERVPTAMIVDANLKNAVAGDTHALSMLLRQHGPTVQNRLRIAAQWRTVLEPEDVMQVTYLEAFLQIRRFDLSRGTTFEGWLEHVAQNNLRDAVRGL